MSRPGTVGKSLARAVLSIAAIGGVALIAIMAPNAFQIIGRGRKRDDWWARVEAERSRVKEAIKRLRQRRLIEYEVRGQETFLKITAEGKTLVRKFEFDEINLPRAKKWDGKWRIVTFDIPEDQALKRKAFRDKLNRIGFLQIQKSVLAYPHHCRDEVEFIGEFLEVSGRIIYFETSDLGNAEIKSRLAFNLI